MKIRNIAVVLLLAISRFEPASLVAQTGTEMVRGSKEGETFVAGGHSAAGGRGDTGIFQVGFRFGGVLVSSHRSNLEYSIDLIPVYYVTQRQNAYGASFTPLNLKYNWTSFTRTVPYVEVGAGILFSNHDVPDGTNRVNFTPQAGIGMHIPIKPGSNRHVAVALRYVEISNAGLASSNPGLNTLMVKVSIGHFCSPNASDYTDQTAKCKYYRP